MRTTAVYNLRERDSLTPITTVIPAKAGIHCGGLFAPPIRSDLPDYV
jgi:hypothetical protein